MYIPVKDNDVHCAYTEGMNNIYIKLPCPLICVHANGYAYSLLYDIIQDAFLKPKHVPDPFLPYSQSLHGLTPQGQLLLLYVTDNVEDLIAKFCTQFVLYHGNTHL